MGPLRYSSIAMIISKPDKLGILQNSGSLSPPAGGNPDRRRARLPHYAGYRDGTLENGITNRQLFFIIITSAIGFSSTTLPQGILREAGTGTWVTLCIGALFFSLDILIIVYLGNVYRGKSLFEYSEVLVGTFVARCFAALYAVYFIVLLSLTIRVSADIIKAEILYKTPIAATMLLITAISLYAALKGLTNIGRLVEFLGTIILGIGIVLYLTAFKQGNILNIMPLFESSQIGTYFKAVPSTIFVFLGFEVITMMPLTKANGKKALRTAVLSIWVLCFFMILIIEACCAVLGIDDIVNYNYPLIVTIRRLDIINLEFAKRLDLFFILIWLLSIFCAITMLIFVAKEYTRRLIKKAGNPIPSAIICGVACIAGLSVQNSTKVSDFFIAFATYGGLIAAFLIPFFLFVVHCVRKALNKC